MTKLIHGGDIYTAMENGDTVLDFSANINPLGIPVTIKDAVIRSLDVCTNYPDPLCRRLKKAMAEKLGISAEHFIFGNGAADLIFRLVQAERPERALLLAPTFAEYEQALRSVDCEVEHYYLDKADSFRLGDDFLNCIDSKFDMIFLCNPNNPTGQLIDTELLTGILAKCKLLGIRLILDECFIDFVKDFDRHTMIGYSNDNPCLFLLRSFTKSFAIPGLRLGYGICSDDNLLHEITEKGQPWSVSLPAQEAGLWALSEDTYLEKSREIVFAERDWLVCELTALGYKVLAPEANYIFFDIIDNANRIAGDSKTEYVECFQKDLEREGILIRCCANYEGLEKGYFRIAVRNHEENILLIAALKRRR